MEIALLIYIMGFFATFVLIGLAGEGVDGAFFCALVWPFVIIALLLVELLKKI